MNAAPIIDDMSMPEPNSGCWLWLGTLKSNGYGAITIGGRFWHAHRLSYALHHGPIADGLDVCHKCDTRLCVNPAHLFVGTRKDNMQDARRKGRLVQSEAKRDAKAGEKSPVHKLTDAEIREIIQYHRCRLSTREVARMYGVAKVTVQQIVYGRYPRLNRTKEKNL